MQITAPEGEIGSLGDARAAIDACRRCPLYRFATQAVFGEGPARAALMLVGEQPGDQEDVQGRPFVGPAGRVFDRAAAAAGIDRDRAYVTNAVKPFKFAPRGQRLQLPGGEWLVATIHPSYLLRMTDRDDAEWQRRQFVADLARAKALAETTHAA